MWRFCNDDKKLMERTDVTAKAVAMPRQDFLEKLLDYVNSLGVSEYEDIPEVNELEDYQDEDLCYELITLLMEYDSKFEDDFDGILVDHANIGGEICTFSNGVTCMIAWMAGDWEEAVFFAVYYDGTRFRAYIPFYGNTVNLRTMSAFGSERDSEKYEVFLEEVKAYFEKHPDAMQDLLERADSDDMEDIIYLNRGLVYNAVYGENMDIALCGDELDSSGGYDAMKADIETNISKE